MWRRMYQTACPYFIWFGYLSSEVKEAGERVRTAIKNSGFDYPAKRTVINLSPATLRKKGASFDLPIAVSILASLGQISPKKIEKCLIIGELSLDGQVRKSAGNTSDCYGSSGKRDYLLYCSKGK